MLANKCDLVDKIVVSIEEGMKLAKENDMLFFVTSAKLNLNIDYAIKELST